MAFTPDYCSAPGNPPRRLPFLLFMFISGSLLPLPTTQCTTEEGSGEEALMRWTAADLGWLVARATGEDPTPKGR
jgi:hypothetical protein